MKLIEMEKQFTERMPFMWSKTRIGQSNHKLKLEKAREMRNNPTRAEAQMWEILNWKVPNFPEHVFYRQSIQFGYILDFYCPTLRLGIEVDGQVHIGRERYDSLRDANLAQKNIQMYRFSNEDVLYNPQGVATQICKIIRARYRRRVENGHA
jgi:leucyl-tRNA synthetase